MKRNLGKIIYEGPIFSRMKNRAVKYLKNPEKLIELVNKAKSKVESVDKEPLKEVWVSLLGFFRLIYLYVKKEYPELPWQSLILIVATILYFLAPLDVIPDFIIGVGYIDDIALINWVAVVMKSDLDNFYKWELKTNR